MVNSTGRTFPVGAVSLQCMTGLNTGARYLFARRPTIELPALFVALDEVAPTGRPLSRVPYRATLKMRGSAFSSICEIGRSLRRRANDREGPGSHCMGALSLQICTGSFCAKPSVASGIATGSFSDMLLAQCRKFTVAVRPNLHSNVHHNKLSHFSAHPILGHDSFG